MTQRPARTISLTALRRLVIEAQGYAGQQRTGTTREVEATIRRLSCVQLDSISAVERSHRIALGSRIAIFDNVYADVGDEQSILASLSTFSAHLKNLVEVLSSATAHSLVLIDELGSGTDPIEGAALGGAILEALTARGTLTVATTHLGALKELATQVDGVVNASLQFDPVALAPTYRLIKGIPGRSYGISIARRLNLPADVLERAEQRIPSGERRVTALLAELEAREKELRVKATSVQLPIAHEMSPPQRA